MSILHLVNRSPAGSSALARCVAVLGPDDALLLIENGVYAALRQGAGAAVLSAVTGARLFVLEPHLAERGLSERSLQPEFRRVGFDGFVELTVACDVIVSWS